MPQLNPAGLERLEKMLAALEPELKELNERSRDFVQQTIERFAQYGVRTFMSPAQMNWLEDLYGKHVGQIDAVSDGADPHAERGEILGDGSDMDDEIPF